MSLVFPTRPTAGCRQAHLVRAVPSPTTRLVTLPLTRRGRPVPHRVTEGAGRSRCPGTDQPLSHAQWVRSSAVCGGQWLPCAWRDRRAGGGVVPHPRPPPPARLKDKCVGPRVGTPATKSKCRATLSRFKDALPWATWVLNLLLHLHFPREKGPCSWSAWPVFCRAEAVLTRKFETSHVGGATGRTLWLLKASAVFCH